MAKHEIEERNDGLIEKMVAVNRVFCIDCSWQWGWADWYGKR